MATLIVDVHGYETSLFLEDPPDYFTCAICTFVLDQPVMIVNCGHKFCEKCFERLREHCEKKGSILRCPTDQNMVDLKEVRFQNYLGGRI